MAFEPHAEPGRDEASSPSAAGTGLALNLRSVEKRFGAAAAVDRLDLGVRRGEFYALLGPNGAGKTTTLRMIAGLLQPDAGGIEVLGVDVTADPAAAKRRIAFLPDEPLLYGKLRCIEYLEFVAGLWGIPPAAASGETERLLNWLELTEQRDSYCDTLSRGMQQKLTLAAALLHEPELLILDEPLTGLDAAASRKIKDHLLELTRRGLTVLFTTHILEVAERMATRIGVIQHGRLLVEGSLAELRARYGGDADTLEDVFLTATGGVG